MRSAAITNIDPGAIAGILSGAKDPRSGPEGSAARDGLRGSLAALRITGECRVIREETQHV